MSVLHRETDRLGASARRSVGGFTLVELLVVIGIVVVLASLTVVAVTRAQEQGRRGATRALMQMVGTAVGQFESDIGSRPPLIHSLDEDDNNAILTPETVELRAQADPLVNASGVRAASLEAYATAGFYSEYTLGVYLLGEGECAGPVDPAALTDDPATPFDETEGYHDGAEGFGSRDPGPSLAWKPRVPAGGGDPWSEHQPARTGRVYGPYLDIGRTDDSVETVRVRVATGGSAGGGDWREGRLYVPADPSDLEDPLLPRLIDPWGNPLRYYTGWQESPLAGDPESGRSATLRRVPPELLSAPTLGRLLDFDEPYEDLDPALDRALIGARYAILSAGEREVISDLATGEELGRFGDVGYAAGSGEMELLVDWSSLPGEAGLDPSALSEEEEVRLLEDAGSNLSYTP